MKELDIQDATDGKTISEVTDLLGPPSNKRRYHEQLLPDCWLLEWDITVISKDDPSIEYPKIGMVFETSTSPVVQYYLDEYLPGRSQP